tara:strand:- start:5042 stop:5539 length:498 start_codon:yes stop_codon:yes gene_type:complete
MTNYNHFFDARYNASLQNKDISKYSRYHYIGDYIFEFTTYDSNITKILALEMCEVLEAVLKKDTLNYIAQSEDHYLKYMIMVNMPFLENKLNWGTSIRGAWFDNYLEYNVADIITVKKGELSNFIEQLLDWVGVDYGIKMYGERPMRGNAPLIGPIWSKNENNFQ